jgi:hypothetical protein
MWAIAITFRPSSIRQLSKFHPHFILFLAWRPSWLEVGITGHNFQGGPPKDHSTKVWLQLAQWFMRRRLKCEMLMDGRRTKSNGNSSHGLKARWARKASVSFKSSSLKPLNLIKPNLAVMVPRWTPLKIVSDSPALHSRWLLLLKIEISSIVHCCFSISQNELKF